MELVVKSKRNAYNIQSWVVVIDLVVFSLFLDVSGGEIWVK